MAAERCLKPGGYLAVASFHSVEDRMVKRFLQSRAGTTGNANRYAPEPDVVTPAFTLESRKAIQPLLRVAVRTDAEPGSIDPETIGLPLLKGKR